MLGWLKAFSLSEVETQGTELLENDISIGIEEGSRSLIGKVSGDKRSNFLGMKRAMMKLWVYKGLSKVVA